VEPEAASLDGDLDARLVAQARGGDLEAFGQIVRRHEDRLYGTVLRLVGSAEDARDLVQETFVKAYERLGAFRGASSIYTWMFRIAVNASLSHRRRRKHDGIGPPIGAEDEDGRPAAWADPSAPDPAGPMMDAETEAAVQRALDGLDADHRAVVVLRDIQNYGYQEIADILGVPAGTVKSRVHRARMELRERLRPLLTA
jgi:RNA polymerase sigma-70 factor (ECF subfamily)